MGIGDSSRQAIAAQLNRVSGDSELLGDGDAAWWTTPRS